jgi:hypothetical protein
VTTKTAAEHPVFRHRAEERGYSARLVDELGELAAESGRPPHGVIVRGPGRTVNMLWVPVGDLAVVGDLLIRAHVQAARRAVS